MHSVEFIERWVDNAAGKTDIDLIVNGVYYQVKRSGDAFKKGARGIVEWVDEARADGATIIRYVTPDGSKIPGAALEQIGEMEIKWGVNIAVDVIPFG